ncbi:unnamed protein product [Sympodiomycopsis kandeliae]
MERISELETSTVLSWLRTTHDDPDASASPISASKQLSTPERPLPPLPRSKFSWTTTGSSSSPGSTFTSPRRYRINDVEKEDSPRSIQLRSEAFQKWSFNRNKRKEPTSPTPRCETGINKVQELMISPKSQLDSSKAIKPSLDTTSGRQSVASYFDFEESSSSDDGHDIRSSFTFLKRRRRLHHKLPRPACQSTNTWMQYRDAKQIHLLSKSNVSRSYTPELSRCSSAASESLESLQSSHAFATAARSSLAGGDGSLLPLTLRAQVDDGQKSNSDTDPGSLRHAIAPWLVHEEPSTQVKKPTHRRQISEPITKTEQPKSLLSYDPQRRPRLTHLSNTVEPTSSIRPERAEPLTPNSLRALQNAILSAKLAI